MPLVYISREIKKAPAGNELVGHPNNIEAKSWNRVTIAWIRSGQSRPYMDSVYSAEIYLEGGAASLVPGFDIPAGTALGAAKVKEIARALVCDFKDAPGPFDARLTELVELKKEAAYSSWRVTITKPYCD